MSRVISPKKRLMVDIPLAPRICGRVRSHQVDFISDWDDTHDESAEQADDLSCTLFSRAEKSLLRAKKRHLFDTISKNRCDRFRMFHRGYAKPHHQLAKYCRILGPRQTVARVDVEFSSEAKAFCETNSLSAYLQKAIDLAKKCFSSLTGLAANVEQDPESDEKWITLMVTASGTVDSILASYNHYSSEWVSSVPAPYRYMIRLSFNIV